MRKQGYTLAEILVAIGIIGVIAAIMLPVFNKIQPDPVKAMYLKTYQAISSAVSNLASDSEIYGAVSNTNADINFSNHTLYNIDAVEIPKRNLYLPEGNTKFGSALAWAFNTKISESYNNEKYDEAGNTGFNPAFTTGSNIAFMVSTERSIDENNVGNYASEIWFDLDGINKGNNCIFNANSCPNPDRFKLVVSGNGLIAPADPKGKDYIANSTNLKKLDSNKNISGDILTAKDTLFELKDKRAKNGNQNETTIKDKFKHLSKADNNEYKPEEGKDKKAIDPKKPNNGSDGEPTPGKRDPIDCDNPCNPDCPNYNPEDPACGPGPGPGPEPTFTNFRIYTDLRNFTITKNRSHGRIWLQEVGSNRPYIDGDNAWMNFNMGEGSQYCDFLPNEGEIDKYTTDVSFEMAFLDKIPEESGICTVIIEAFINDDIVATGLLRLNYNAAGRETPKTTTDSDTDITVSSPNIQLN